MLTLLVSCEKETEDISVITSKPIFELVGNSVELLKVGQEYVDAGVNVYEISGEDTTVLTGYEVVSSLQTGVKGEYTISYSIKNSDGIVFYSDDVTRKVIVYDDDVTGVYSSSVVRNGVQMGITGTVLIVKIADGLYTYSDWIGGWYDQYYGYGSRYAFSGVIGLQNGEVTHVSSSDPWGYAGSLLDDPAPYHDQENGIIYYVYSWTAGYDFEVTLTKN